METAIRIFGSRNKAEQRRSLWRKSKRLGLLTLVAAAIAFAEPGANAQTLPTEIAISPPDSQISTGQTQQFSVVGTPIPLQGAIAIAAGLHHACALLANGTVECWGSNTDGQLGDGTLSSSVNPVQVSGLAGAMAIAAGGNYTCALLSNGTVECWGLEVDGELGDGNTAYLSEIPVPVNGLSGAVAIAAAGTHTCALLSNGTVECWGSNFYGQLGNGTTTNSNTPVAVSGLSGATAIAAGGPPDSSGQDYSCALLSNGAVECWGDDYYSQLGNGTEAQDSSTPVVVSGLSGATAITAADDHACAALAYGTVECWGFNSSGELGNGTTTESSTPVAVSGLSGLSGTTPLSAGFDHTCAVLSGGTVECWGDNSDGELGNGTTTNSAIPVAVSGLSGGATAVAAGFEFTCALLSGGNVECWGNNLLGQLGNAATSAPQVTTPVMVTGYLLPVRGAVQVTVGDVHTCALLSDATVECWGYNGRGQLGNGTTTASSIPVAVSGLSGVTGITAGTEYTCALLSNGTGECWGDNVYGNVGDGTTLTQYSTPVAVSSLSGANAMTAGTDHTCALLYDGESECWGLNFYGALGNGGTTDSPIPSAVSGAYLATAISAGDSTTCALISDGTVQCWGLNQFGEIGNGTTNQSDVPLVVLGTAKAITSNWHSCALISDGSVECWGYNGSGELGNGTTTNSDTPVAVIGLSGAKAIIDGYESTCALLSGGTVECWGGNVYGELGNGTNTNSNIPVAVIGLSGVVAIASGGSGGFAAQTCALISNGTIECWGNNSYGQLGNGGTSSSLIPVVATGLGGATGLAPTLVWTSSNPSVATIDAGSGLATGVAPGTTTITATYGSLSATTTLTVGSGTPTITSAAGATFTVGSAGSFTVTTTGDPAPSLTEAGPLPSGVTFTDNGNGTGMLAGAPGAGTAGTYSLTFTASNGMSPNATQSFKLTVDQTPAITSGASTTFTAGTPGTFTVTTTGFPTPSLTETGALPSGVTFVDNGNGTGTLAGAGTGGTYSLTFTASNGTSPNATQSFTLNVDQAPAITSGASTTFSAGIPGTFTVTTTGFPPPSLTETGTLLSGVTFIDNGNGTATIAGTVIEAGPEFITITAQNGQSPNAAQNFTLTVSPGSVAIVTISPAHATITSGGSVIYSATGYDEYGNNLDSVTSATVFSISPDGSCTGASCTATVAGAHTVTGTVGGITSNSASLLVQASPIVNFGSSNVGTATTRQTLNYTFTSATTLTAVNILTMGAPGLDYKDGGSSTCSPAAYTAGQSCVVTVAFNPTAPGARAGAVTLFAQGGTLPLMTWYLSGAGQSAAVTIDPGTLTPTTLTGTQTPAAYGSAVDAVGNVYVVDNANNAVLKLAAGTFSQSTAVSGLSGPTAVALDGAGDLFISNGSNVVMVPNENGSLNPADQSTVNISGLGSAEGVAVDASGDLYVADATNGDVVELSSQGVQTTIASGLTSPHGVAVDAALNVYVATNDGVTQYPPGGGAAVPYGTGYSDPRGVAVDAAGAVYVADTGNNQIVRVAPGGASQSTLPITGVSSPQSVSVDASGNLYVTYASTVIQVNRTQAAQLNFPTTNVGLTSATQVVTVTDAGNQELEVSNLVISANFASEPSGGTDCTSSTSLSPGGQCEIGVAFAPTEGGTLTGSASLTDKALNNPASTQSVLLSGGASQATQTITFTTPAPPSAAYNSGFTVAATASSGLAAAIAGTGSCSGSGSAGSATITMTSGTGTCTVTATQAGNGNYSAATPVTETVSATLASQSIMVTVPAPATATLGSSFTVVASSTSGLPVTFGSSGGCTNSGGTYAMASSGKKACTITMNQAGNGNYLAAPEVMETVTVAAAIVPTMSFTGAPSSAPFWSTFVVAASSNSTSSPTFTTSGPCTIEDTTLVVTITSGSGTCTMTATWAANDVYAKATASQKTTAGKDTTTTGLTSSQNPSSYGQSVMFTASVTPQITGTPTGSVSFYSGSSKLATVALAGGSASYTTAKLLAGTASITAVYNGSGDYGTSTSDAVNQVVNLANTTTTITRNSPEPSKTGQAVTVDFSVTQAVSTFHPTGSVTVSDSYGDTCTGTLSGGKGSCKITINTEGSTILTANYGGDANDSGSVSGTVTQTVN